MLGMKPCGEHSIRKRTPPWTSLFLAASVKEALGLLTIISGLVSGSGVAVPFGLGTGTGVRSFVLISTGDTVTVDKRVASATGAVDSRANLIESKKRFITG